MTTKMMAINWTALLIGILQHLILATLIISGICIIAMAIIYAKLEKDGVSKLVATVEIITGILCIALAVIMRVTHL